MNPPAPANALSSEPAAVAHAPAAPPRGGWLPRFLWPPPPAPPVSDEAEVRRAFRYFRPRILLWSTIGYGMFYFVRRNYDAVIPIIQNDLHFSKSMLGLILTLHGVLYGISKLVNGFLADRANARLFMATALIICAAINILFGMSSSIVLFAVLWMINGWFQGMGYPPCARLLTHWFAPKELATKMSIWNASHSLGAAGIVVLCGFIVSRTGSWRLCFFIPAALAVVTALLLLTYLRDTPESLGLPEIEGTAPADELESNAGRSDADFRQFLRVKVFGNKYIWLVAFANFFVYTIRMAVFSWGTLLLKETKGLDLTDSTLVVAAFEAAGLCGMLVTGWLTDRLFNGRAAPLCVICMLLCAAAVAGFWKIPASHSNWGIAVLIVLGFLIYGPQALVAVIVAHLATKRGTATAVGVISVFAYGSTILSGIGIGALVQHYGWNYVFAMLIASALIGAGLFALVLPAKGHGQAA